MTEDYERQVRFEHWKASSDVVREIGIFAIKTILTLNSGALVVLLAFLGNASSNTRFNIPVNAIQISMFAFLIGILLCLSSVAYTYGAAQAATPFPEYGPQKHRWYVPIVVLQNGLATSAFFIGAALLILNLEAKP